MGPRTERSAGQRTFLLLMLIAVIFLASILKLIATASNLPASVGIFLLSDDATRHLRVVMYI